MPRRPPNFDRLAPIYRALEFAAFGRDLERARFCFLPELAACRRLLILGEGDGRCLARIVRIAPEAAIDCVDLSRAMLDRAARRLAAEGTGGRVNFIHSDVFALELRPGEYDAVMTYFFLDCFETAEVASVIGRIQPGLRPEARWLFADFVLPQRGWARWRARIWVALLYAFFRWETGLRTRALPESERLLLEAGWRREKSRDFQCGLIRSSVWRRTAPP